MTKDDIDEHDRIPAKIPLIDQPAGIIKSWHLMRQNVLNIVPAAATTEKTLSGRTGKRWHMIMDPSCIQRMLIERLQDYPKSTVTKNLLRPAIGESLFIAEGAEWRWQRRTSAPAFSHRSVTGLGPVMTRAAENCATRIAQAGPRAINMLDEMIATTFDVIADVTFSGDGSFHKDTVHDAIDSYVSDAGRVSLLDVLGAGARLDTSARAHGLFRYNGSDETRCGCRNRTARSATEGHGQPGPPRSASGGTGSTERTPHEHVRTARQSAYLYCRRA